MDVEPIEDPLSDLAAYVNAIDGLFGPSDTREERIEKLTRAAIELHEPPAAPEKLDEGTWPPTTEPSERPPSSRIVQIVAAAPGWTVSESAYGDDDRRAVACWGLTESGRALPLVAAGGRLEPAAERYVYEPGEK